MKRRLLVPLILISVLAALSVIIPPVTGSKPMLGLDLQGGFSVVLQAKPVKGELPSEEGVERAKEIIRQRVDGLGVAEPDITRQGRTVVVQLPGVTDRAKAESVIGCTARLEFRPVLQVAPNLAVVDESTLTPEGIPVPGDEPGADPTGDAPSDTPGDDGTPADETPPSTDGEKSKDNEKAPADESPAPSGDDEQGAGTVGLVPGEAAMPAQFPATSTTTTPPTTETPDSTGAQTTDSTPAPGSEDDDDGGCGQNVYPIDDSVFAGAEGDVMTSEDGALLYLLGPSDVDGEVLSKAEATLLENGQWVVMASVRGADRIRANEMFNGCASGQPQCPTRQMAIALDGQVMSAPEVQAMNLADDEFTISGDFDATSAKELALVLRYGSLPVVFEQAALQQVSATLGSDSLRAGMIAGAIGIVALGVYMVLYYRGFGMTVVASLLVWMALMYGLVCFLSETQGLALTLAGITGIIVSVGTTVDTYVVVFERVKDLVREGKSVRRATELGYESGIRTVFTANGAAFIGAFLLWWLTVGPVRGFAYFLGLSVILDLIVAVVFTRPLILLAARSDRFTRSRFFGVAVATDTNASGRRRSGRTRRSEVDHD